MGRGSVRKKHKRQESGPGKGAVVVAGAELGMLPVGVHQFSAVAPSCVYGVTDLIEIKDEDGALVSTFRAKPKGKLFSEVVVQLQRMGYEGILLDGAICLSDTDLLTPGRTYTFRPSRSAPDGDSPLKKTKRSPDETAESLAAATNSYFNELLQAPGELPSSVKDLWLFLSQRPVKLPLHLQTFYSVMEPELVTVFACAKEQKLAAFLESAFFLIKQVPGNEAQSSSHLSFITGEFLKFLDENAPVGKQLLGLETKLDSANPSASTTAALSFLKRLKRPDFQLFVSGTLLLRWENKIDPADRGVARDENVEKLKVWSPLYYGELPYVIGGWCGGRLFQWLKLSPSGKEIVAEPISVVYDLSRLSGGALFLHSIIRMHCLLRKLQDKLTYTPPLSLYKAIPRGDDGGWVTFYPEFVSKEVVPALSRGRVEELESLYDVIKGSRYLIQLHSKIRTFCSKTVLTLHPVGDPSARPRDLEQLRNAMHDLLHALQVLHKVGYTHRDLRWPNCIRVNVKSEWKWVLIDLENGGRDGAKWEGGELMHWDAETLEVRDGRKVYTKRSDMYELGKLIVQWLDSQSVTNIEMRTWGEKMQKDRPGAAQMLKEICLKNCARCAKF